MKNHTRKRGPYQKGSSITRTSERYMSISTELSNTESDTEIEFQDNRKIYI